MCLVHASGLLATITPHKTLESIVMLTSDPHRIVPGTLYIQSADTFVAGHTL